MYKNVILVKGNHGSIDTFGGVMPNLGVKMFHSPYLFNYTSFYRISPIDSIFDRIDARSKAMRISGLRTFRGPMFINYS